MRNSYGAVFSLFQITNGILQVNLSGYNVGGNYESDRTSQEYE